MQAGVSCFVGDTVTYPDLDRVSGLWWIAAQPLWSHVYKSRRLLKLRCLVRQQLVPAMWVDG